MNENQDLAVLGDDFDDLDDLFAQFDGVAVEGGVDAGNAEDDCAGGACGCVSGCFGISGCLLWGLGRRVGRALMGGKDWTQTGKRRA